MQIKEILKENLQPTSIIKDHNGTEFSWDSARLSNGDFSGFNFEKLDLSDFTFLNCNLSGANFNKADLSNTFIKDCVLSGATFKFAILQHSKVVDCNLTSASFTGVKGDYMTIKDCNATKTDFSATSLKNAQLDSDFRQANFTGTRLNWASLLNSDFREAILTYAELEGTSLGFATISEEQLKTVNDLTHMQLNTWRKNRSKTIKGSEIGGNASEILGLSTEEFKNYTQPVIEKLHTKCSEVLSICKQEDLWLYRGMRIADPKTLFLSHSPTNRKPVDSDLAAQEKYDKMLDALDIKAQRHNSIFVTSDVSQALGFALNKSKNIYVILPKNNFSFSWSSRKDPVFSDISLIPDSLDEFQEKFRVMDTNLKAALNSENEILIHGEYYAVNYPIWKRVLELQLI